MAASVLLIDVPATWAGGFTSPAATGQHPFVVPVDSKGDPLPFTISGSGWTPRSIVYVEVCDGKSPQTVGWMPTLDCDYETEPAGVIANAAGTVTFPASNPNFQIGVFRGDSPQQLFNCVAAHQAAPNDDVPTWRNCQIRMTTTYAMASTNDAFLPIILPDLASSPTGSGAGASPGSGTSTSSTTSSTSPSGNRGTPSASVHAVGKSGHGALASTGARIGALVALGLGLLISGYGAVTAARRPGAQDQPN